MAGILQRLFGIGGAAGFGVAANVFVGMVEAPLMIRAWLARMTRAELFVVMTAGLATISGNTLVVYALMIAPVVPDAAGQLLTASLISAPAAIRRMNCAPIFASLAGAKLSLFKPATHCTAPIKNLRFVPPKKPRQIC